MNSPPAPSSEDPVEIWRRYRNESPAVPVSTGPKKPWHGTALFDDTIVRKIRVEDLPSIEKCYEPSQIPDHDILRVAGETIRQMEGVLTKGPRRGGMLHSFRQPRRLATDPSVQIESVYEETERQLRQTELDTEQGFPKRDGMSPAIYEGAALVAQNNVDDFLAWATWWRSSEPDPDKRTYRNDEATRMVAKLFQGKERIQMNAGFNARDYFKSAPHTLLFDTLNGKEPGAADVLMNKLIPQWRGLYYRYFEAFHWARLRAPGAARQDAHDLEGDNVDSAYFFNRLGLSHIGSRVDPKWAVRVINGKEYLIEGTESWMTAPLEKMQLRSNQRIQELRDRFSGV